MRARLGGTSESPVVIFRENFVTLLNEEETKTLVVDLISILESMGYSISIETIRQEVGTIQ